MAVDRAACACFPDAPYCSHPSDRFPPYGPSASDILSPAMTGELTGHGARPSLLRQAQILEHGCRRLAFLLEGDDELVMRLVEVEPTALLEDVLPAGTLHHLLRRFRQGRQVLVL